MSAAAAATGESALEANAMAPRPVVLKLSPKTARRRTFALVFACLLPFAARADDEAGRVRAVVDATIRPLMSRHDILGMAVALTIDGRPYVFDYGVASKEARTPVDGTTLFEIGSVSKTLTVTLAAYAQATGRLSLTDHPGRFVPSLRGRPIDRATLVHLGTYTAGGLPLQFPDEVANDDDGAIGYLRTWKASAKPGIERRYSNPSLGLLGYVTGIAMKDGFAASMQTRLLPMLGMSHSHLHVPPAAMVDYAWGYRDGKPVRVHPGPFDAETYGIKTTASDLLRFVQANIDPSRLELPLRRAVEATHVGYYRVGGMVQGLGWEQYPWPLSRELLLRGNSAEVIGDATAVRPATPQSSTASRLFDKTGSTGGFGAYVAFVPARRIGIVMLANSNYPIPARVEAAHSILNQLASGGR